jgi:cytochrome c peroxidase
LIGFASLTACEGTDAGSTLDPSEGSLPGEVTSVLDLPETAYNYADIALPAHFNTDFVRAMDNTPADNPITDDGATLGRVLFYDTALSANGTIACASCHIQEHAFADPERLSLGFEGGRTGRNAMGLIDARYYRNGRFFWDERAETLEDQVLMPIQNTVEMGLTLDELVERVSAEAYYPYLFERAFGDPEVTSDRISKALAQFVRAIVSYRSRFDEGLARTGDIRAPFPSFTPEENQGKELFGRSGCGACHLDNGPPGPGPLRNQAIFFIDRATNNGLPALDGAEDNGVGDISGDPRDDGRFKSPSLRNVALTAPYMHDGRFTTLEEVIEHYSTGVVASPNLDPRLRVPNTNPPEARRLDLTPAEVAALAAFLRTLTDDQLVADEKYSNPFL